VKTSKGEVEREVVGEKFVELFEALEREVVGKLSCRTESIN